MKPANPVTHGHSAGNVPDEWVFIFSMIRKGNLCPSPNSLEERILAGCFSKIFLDFFLSGVKVLNHGLFVEPQSSSDFSERHTLNRF